MSLPPTVASAFEVQLAELRAGGRVALVPQPPLLWGVDLWCVTDCDSAFSELPVNSPLIIAQAITRRLLTPRGGLLDDADYGLDLRSYCNHGVTQQDLRTLQTRATAEALKDERVQTATVEVAFLNAGPAVRTTPIASDARLPARASRVGTFAFLQTDAVLVNTKFIGVRVELVPADPALAPFAFVLAVSDETTLLELI